MSINLNELTLNELTLNELTLKLINTYVFYCRSETLFILKSDHHLSKKLFYLLQ